MIGCAAQERVDEVSIGCVNLDTIETGGFGGVDAGQYLAQFAKLVRKNLESVRIGTISLEDELERLELYLKIEQMRFGDKLKYSIHLNDILDPTDIRIPSMILQPFVENAIWHGIMPSDLAGRIVVSISENDGFLHIGSGDEHYFCQVKRHFQIMIAKGVVLLRVQHFQ